MPIDTNLIFHEYLKQFNPLFIEKLFKDPRIFRKYYPVIMNQGFKWFAGKLNPFRMCPDTIIFWYFVRPFSAIGIAIRDLHNVQIFWRQQMEPNETIYLLFRVIEIKSPYSLTLLVTFASLALVIIDAAYRVFGTITGQNEQRQRKTDQNINLLMEPAELEEMINQEQTLQDHNSLLKQLDPFNLTPRMSIYYPIYDHHTSIGFLTIDFRHIELSLRQSLEPNDNIVSLIRFFDLYSVFPLQIAAMILSFGLFINGAIYKLEQTKYERPE